MAFGALAIWESQPGVGSDTANGGGFDPLATMATDLAATVATGVAPVVTSASYNFAAGDIGAYLFVQLGTHWIPGWYLIASVASNAATLTATVGSAVLWSNPQVGALNPTAGCATTASPTGGTWSIDYSRSSTPRISYTDMVIGGTTTQFTSAANPVGPNIVGNIFAVTSGTGFTAQWVEAMSVSGTTATCDKSLGTTASTGGHGGLGGCLATVGKAGSLHIGRNTIFCKQGALTLSNSSNVAGGYITLAGGSGTDTFLVGYNTTRTLTNTDTGPTFTPGANSMICVDAGGSNVTVSNIIVDNSVAAKTGVTAFDMAGNFGTITRCTAKSPATGFDCGGANISHVSCYVSAATSVAYNQEGLRSISYLDCHSLNSAGGSDFSSSGIGAFHSRCVIYKPHSIGFSASGTGADIFVDCVVYQPQTNGGSGFYFNSTSQCVCMNCITVTGTATGVTGFNSDGSTNFLFACADYNSATPAASGSVNSGFITLSGDPFVSASSGNFALNSIAGAGAALQGAGYPSSLFGLSTTSYPDVGAAQHAPAAAGATAWAY
jgi:hypothetical protein